MEGYTAQPESWRWFSIGTIKMAWCLTNKHLHVYKILSPPCKLTKSSTGDFFIVAVRIQLNLDNTFKNDIPVSCKTQQISCTFRNLTPQMKGPNLEVALKGDKKRSEQEFSELWRPPSAGQRPVCVTDILKFFASKAPQSLIGQLTIIFYTLYELIMNFLFN